MGNIPWHLIIYKVPSEPSRKRIYVWRELKKLGGLYLQQSACIFPDVPQVVEQLDAIKTKIIEFEGEAFIFNGITMDSEQEERVINSFRGIRDDEYNEIHREITKFIAEIEKEIRINKFTTEELEEEESEMEKLKRWHQRARERDWFAATGRARVEDLFAEAERMLARFTEVVYRNNVDL